MRKGKTRKIGVAVERPATTYAQITTSSPGIFPKKHFFRENPSGRGCPNQLNRVKRVANHNPYFLKPPKWNGAKHVTFQREFSVFPCKWCDPPRFD